MFAVQAARPLRAAAPEGRPRRDMPVGAEHLSFSPAPLSHGSPGVRARSHAGAVLGRARRGLPAGTAHAASGPPAFRAGPARTSAPVHGSL